mgnify:CR=1 FL=1
MHLVTMVMTVHLQLQIHCVEQLRLHMQLTVVRLERFQRIWLLERIQLLYVMRMEMKVLTMQSRSEVLQDQVV